MQSPSATLDVAATLSINIQKLLNTPEPGWLRRIALDRVAPPALFVAAAEHGSFRRAGVHLRSRNRPSAGASGILKTRSVSRCHPALKRVNLTLAGQRFLNRTRQALDQIREGNRRSGYARARRGRPLEDWPVLPTCPPAFCATCSRPMTAAMREFHIDFVEAPAESHAAAIRRFDLDAAFVLGRQSWPDCDAISSWSETLLFALPRLHPLVQRDVLSWRDLVDETFLVRTEGSGNEVRGFLERKFRELDISPRISTQQVARYSLLGLVATGRGIVPVLESETVIGLPEVVFRPLAGEAIPFSVSIPQE